MLEKTITFMFWLTDIFTKCRDPFFEEYRQHWRQMIIFSMSALLGFVCAILFTPTDAPVTGMRLVINSVTNLFYLGSLVVILFAAIGFLWASYQYWIFVDGNKS